MSSLIHKLRHTPLRDLLRGRLTGRLDIEALIDQAAIPEPCADCVREVIKRTKLWRLEKIDVAHELIAHFQDGIESGALPQDMATHFGDTRSTAKLIRRAKKRKRPMAWHMMRWMSWAFAAMIAIYLGLAVVLFTGKPSIEVNYLAKLNRRAAAVPVDQSAWPLYQKTLADWIVIEEPYGQKDLYENGSKPGSPRWDDIVQLLSEHQALIEQMRLAGTKPGLGFCASYDDHDADRDFAESRLQSTENPPPADQILNTVLLPQVSRLRHAARLLSIDARLAFIEQDSDRACRDLIAMLGISNHVAETPVLISGLAGVSIRQLMVKTLGELIAKKADMFSDAQLQDFAHCISQHRTDSLLHFDGERYMFMDLVQHLYSKDGWLTNAGIKLLRESSIGESTPTETGRNMLTLPAHMLLSASRDEMVDTFNQHVDKIELAMAIPMHEMPSAGVDEFLVGLTQYQKFRLFLAKGMLPALESVRTTHTKHQAAIDATLTAISLELFRRDHDRWPKTLDELSPRYLPAVPIDRINGEPLQYRIQQNGQPMIYSVGCDLDDDGGQVNPDPRQRTAQWFTSAQRAGEDIPDGDWVLWPKPTTPE